MISKLYQIKEGANKIRKFKISKKHSVTVVILDKIKVCLRKKHQDDLLKIYNKGSKRMIEEFNIVSIIKKLRMIKIQNQDNQIGLIDLT